MDKVPESRSRENRGRGTEGGQPDRERAHDPEATARAGMSSEGVTADDAETMASTGNSEASFMDTVAGTATGIGIDRGESIGTGGLAAGEDLDPVAEGDYWRENLRREPYSDVSAPYERSLELLLDRPEPEAEDLEEEGRGSRPEDEGEENEE